MNRLSPFTRAPYHFFIPLEKISFLNTLHLLSPHNPTNKESLMNKAIVLFSLLLLGPAAQAGDAGYFSSTCTSASGRTVLTQLSDYTNEMYIYTLVIDGVPAIYNLSDKSITEEGDDGYLTYYKNGKKAFSIQKPENTITVYQDPRTGTIAENNAEATPITITVSCKDFWPNP